MLIAVTATGAAWVVTWKLPAAGLIAKRAVALNAAAVVGHAGVPPPVAEATLVGAVEKKTRAPAVRVPTAAVITLAVVHVTARGAEKVVSMKLFAEGLMAYRVVVTNWPALDGHGTNPPPAAAVMDAGAVPKKTR